MVTYPASESFMSERCTRTELFKHKSAEPERTSGDSIVQLHALKPTKVCLDQAQMYLSIFLKSCNEGNYTASLYNLF